MDGADRVKYSAVFACLAVAMMFLVKPPWLFDATGAPKPFGLGPGQSLISVGSCTVLSAVLSLFLFTWIDLVFS